MLFYNSKKKFIGMDEDSLSSLGFSNLSELMSESADFADLFVRTPGFIHNFKYVHWIDYITYGGSSDIPKAIIHTKTKNYWCNINISTMYMSDEPASKAYTIHLVNLRELSQKETENMIADIDAKPAPYAIDIEEAPYIHPSVKENIKKSIIEQNKSLASQVDTNHRETPQQHQAVTQQTIVPTADKTPDINTALDIEDDIFAQSSPQEAIEEAPAEVPDKKIQAPLIQAVDDDLNVDRNYTFDPQVASDELGLPLDLIEEFIEDFIAQAKEFKDDLYNYINEEDINNVRILSHKLKGVAANLRVEDAFEVLSTANTSDNIEVIRKNLDYFYIVIAKLNGEEPIAIFEENTASTEENEFVLDFKDTDEQIEEKNTTVEIQANDNNEEELDLQLDDDIQETNTTPYYDKESVIKELGIEASNFDELLSDYTADANDLCNSIKQDIGSHSQQEWSKKVSKLKGMSESMKTYHLIDNEINTLLETSEQSVANDAIDKITQVISNIKV